MRERVVVAGAGIIGSVIVRQILAERPGTEIIAIDRDLVGSGASRRSAGLHFPVGRTERVRAMTEMSERYYQALAARDPSLPIYPVAMHAVAFGTAAEAAWRNFIKAGPIETSPPACRRVAMGQPVGASVWSVPGCHYTDVATLAGRLVREFRSAISLLEGVAVANIREEAGAAVLVLSTGETLRADRLILAPGPWVNAPAWRALVAPLGIRIKKIIALHLDAPVEKADAAVVFPEEDAFLLPLQHRGHWLFSYTCLDWDVDPDAPQPGVSRQNLDEAQAVLRRYAPELVEKLRSGRVFCDAYSPSREPIVARVGASGRIIFAGAANGSGYRLAPAIAAETLRLLDD
ncbi:NAD(P)/FAD-dependent oxidoreductase [Bradyrhizobium guangzhouense]|uniref:FAD-binding oxidoreductase n=1 Tax=Bradyrhizobium guangzhouense TaxID=1325095 RepID=A0AAE5WY42_9BRAD|nr:FAD-binding oxidoreductase [Bradyrhizobium guangzhouense]QAU45216.1 FAD-binding oxidoreductase [Bradyrhizobium guangzhouense]RXH12422.1 FAD-binding oxidoreductase [Bradyrhizobium guangzhouense]